MKMFGGYCEMPRVKVGELLPNVADLSLPVSTYKNRDRAIRTDLHGLTAIVSRCLSTVDLCVTSRVN